MKNWCIFLSCFIAVSCGKYKEPIVNLNGNTIVKMGHAGMGVGNTLPMNSKESLLKCLSFEMDGTEMDIQLTKDSVLVIFHDHYLEESTNLTGIINDKTWEELKGAKYIQTPHVQYSLVRLDDFFSGLILTDHLFSFDVKSYSNKPYFTYIADLRRAILKFCADHQLENHLMIESWDTELLRQLKLENPNLPLYYYQGDSFQDGYQIALQEGFTGITISNEHITKSEIELAHAAGLKVITWNTHTKKQNKAAVLKNPDFIETDDVPFLANYLP